MQTIYDANDLGTLSQSERYSRAREYTFNCVQLPTGRWQVVNVTLNANVGTPVIGREVALRRVREFNNPWRGAAS